MLAILQSLGTFIIDLFKSRRRLEAETLFLRHQLSIALRPTPPRLRLRGSDRALLVLERDHNMDLRFSAFVGFVLHNNAHYNFRILCARLRPLVLNNLQFFGLCEHSLHKYPTLPFRKSYSGVVVVQPGQDWDDDNGTGTGALDRPTQGRILAQRQVRAHLIVVCRIRSENLPLPKSFWQTTGSNRYLWSHPTGFGYCPGPRDEQQPIHRYCRRYYRTFDCDASVRTLRRVSGEGWKPRYGAASAQTTRLCKPSP
jgi:hypothetical protein